MISASLNRCKGMEDQVGDFLKQPAAKLELVLLMLEIKKLFCNKNMDNARATRVLH